MLSEITITCFAASYLVSLTLEVSRLFFRIPVRLVVMIGFAAAGLIAHSIFLWNEARLGVGGGAPLSSWYHWCLMAAWILAAAYLGLMIRRSQTAVGLFLLPLVLLLIGIAVLYGERPFAQPVALWRWGMIHGIALLLGTTSVLLGFAAGLMYLLQAYRLKHKLLPRQGFRLPSLEWLGRFNRESLLISASLLFVGLLSGIIMNFVRHSSANAKVPWSDPVVWTSGILFLWLIAASLFEFFYKPARQGRKVAYLTIASFIFLVLVMAFVMFGSSEHVSPRPTEEVEVSLFLAWLVWVLPYPTIGFISSWGGQ